MYVKGQIQDKNMYNNYIHKPKGHLTRLPNKKLQKQLQFTGNSDVFWNHCGSLLGGMSSEQARRTLHVKTDLENAIRLQFG